MIIAGFWNNERFQRMKNGIYAFLAVPGKFFNIFRQNLSLIDVIELCRDYANIDDV